MDQEDLVQLDSVQAELEVKEASAVESLQVSLLQVRPSNLHQTFSKGNKVVILLQPMPIFPHQNRHLVIHLLAVAPLWSYLIRETTQPQHSKALLRHCLT